jgi:hypothetical protein
MGLVRKETKSHAKFYAKSSVNRDYFNCFGDPDTAERILGR